MNGATDVAWDLCVGLDLVVRLATCARQWRLSELKERMILWPVS
jgi:hypothetical protein